MNYTSRVQHCNCLAGLLEYVSKSNFIRLLVIFNPLIEMAMIDALHHYKDLLGILEYVMYLYKSMSGILLAYQFN